MSRSVVVFAARDANIAAAGRNIQLVLAVSASMKIEIWSDVACPWCYIGKRRFETALNAFPHKDSVEVAWRSFQLDPTLPDHYDGTETSYLSDLRGMDPEQVSAMFANVAQQAKGEGLNYKFGDVVVANSFSAHQLLHLAASHDAADAVKEALLSAHFEHGADIGARDTLVRIGTEAGLDAGEINEALDTEKFAEDVRSDIAEARTIGVTGVPFFVIDRQYGISGAQPAASITRALNTAWNAANPLTMVESEAPSCGAGGCDCNCG